MGSDSNPRRLDIGYVLHPLAEIAVEIGRYGALSLVQRFLSKRRPIDRRASHNGEGAGGIGSLFDTRDDRRLRSEGLSAQNRRARTQQPATREIHSEAPLVGGF